MMTETLPDKNLPWPILWEGVEEIARSEGCRLQAYQDIAGVWTIGWGETQGVQADGQWTQGEADRNLCTRLNWFAGHVRRLLKIKTSPRQFAALVSLAYNIGVNAFAGSSVLRYHNTGDFDAAAATFALWNKARIKGSLQPVAGLTSRRAREADLYREGI